MEYFDVEIRVPYADVDKMGVVYYANYLVYFERGRTEFLRAIGLDYRSIEKDHSLFLPAMHVDVDYRSPVRYDDLIIVRTFITELKKASISFMYDILRGSNEILAQGASKHVFINDSWKPTRIPKALMQKIALHVAKS